MIKNYLKVAIRNLIKQKYFTFINIIGLTLGIAASVLIFLWTSHELSFDKYQPDYKQIYRVNSDARINSQVFKIGVVPSPLAEEYAGINPEVEKTGRCSQYFDQVFRYKDNSFKENKVILADTGFFQLFNFEFIEGDPNKPFANKESVVITESIAKKYFGEESAMDKLLIIDRNNSVTVSAVIADPPSNSHNQFSMALYFNVGDNWGNFNWATYVKFSKNFSETKAQASLDEIVANNILPTLTGFFGVTVDEFTFNGNYINLYLQPLSDIHLNPKELGELEPAGNKSYVTFFNIIAIFILIIAGINYINLSTAYYDNRKLEVGIRKTNGASSLSFFKQFIFESVFISLVVYLLAILVINVVLPFYVKYLDIEINTAITKNISFLALLFFGVLALGILSASYPTTYLSRFKVINILHNKIKSRASHGFNLRSVLVITQFTITIIVIVATLLVKKQVGFLLNKELGYNKDHIVVVEGTNRLEDQKETFKTELKNYAQIVNTCFADTYPGENYNNITGYGVKESGPEQGYIIKTISAGEGYFETYEMNMVAGRSFTSTDRNSVVLNQQAVKSLGITDNPTSYHILKDNSVLQLVGVVENFNHDALNISLDPIIIRQRDDRYLDNAIIRISGNDTKETLKFIEDTWKDISNNLPFEYVFLDSKLRSAYNTEMKAGKVFTIFSILSVIIACMGVLGITSFLIHRRIKEIGIRKVNGAKVIDVLANLNKDIIIWVAIAFMVGCPLAYYAMNNWLENFAYKTEISWWVFILAGAIALFIALVTVSFQSLKAAMRNPVEALRYE